MSGQDPCILVGEEKIKFAQHLCKRERCYSYFYSVITLSMAFKGCFDLITEVLMNNVLCNNIIFFLIINIKLLRKLYLKF